MMRPVLLPAACSAALAATAGAADFSFSAPIESLLPKGQTPIALRLRDLDGDAKLDVIVTGRNWDGETGTGARVAILKGDGAGAFAPWREAFVLEGQAEDARLADMNGDGVTDLVVAVAGPVSRVALFLAQPDGVFGAPTYTQVERQPRGLCVADLDGDGDLDVACVNYNSDSLSILRNDGGTLTPLSVTRLLRYIGGIGFPQQVTDLDLNGDGRMDLIITTLGAGRVSLMSQTASGTMANPIDWKPAPINNEPPAVIGSSIADFDSEGTLDIALPVLLTTQSPKVVTFRGGSAGLQQERVHELFAPAYAWCSTAGDFDQDGRVDIAVGTALPGGISFSRNLTPSSGAPIELTPQPIYIPYGTFVRELANADLDSDGDIDIVGIEIAGSTLFALLNTTGQGVAGVAEPRQPVKETRPPGAMPVVPDLNRDGQIGAVDLALWLGEWSAERRSAPPSADRGTNAARKEQAR